MTKLYNSRGRSIGYSKKEAIFNIYGRKVGQVTKDRQVTNRNGKYIGTIVDENRLFYLPHHREIRGQRFSTTISQVENIEKINPVNLPDGAHDVKLDDL